MQLAAPLARPMRGSLGPRPLLFAFLALVALIGVGVVAYLRIQSQQLPAPQGQIIPVRRNTVASTVNATGSVVATKQAKLVFANSGRIKDILVNVGDQVTAGQPLARLATDTNQLKLDTARSQLTSAQLKLQQLTESATPEEL